MFRAISCALAKLASRELERSSARDEFWPRFETCPLGVHRGVSGFVIHRARKLKTEWALSFLARPIGKLGRLIQDSTSTGDVCRSKRCTDAKTANDLGETCYLFQVPMLVFRVLRDWVKELRSSFGVVHEREPKTKNKISP